MSKIRGFKPDLWTDEDFVGLTPYARLLWMGMWNHACDNGHLADKPKQIKMRVLPFDDVNVAELLRELADAHRIERSDGVITIPNFTKHQKPDKRWFQVCEGDPNCPKPGDSQPETRSGPTRTRGASQGPPPDVDVEVNRSEVKVREKRAHRAPANFAPNDTNRRIATECGVPIDRVVAQFLDHHRAKGSTYVDWHLALNTWIRREKPTSSPRPARKLPTQHELPPDGLSPQQYAEWEYAQRQKRAKP